MWVCGFVDFFMTCKWVFTILRAISDTVPDLRFEFSFLRLLNQTQSHIFGGEAIKILIEFLFQCTLMFILLGGG